MINWRFASLWSIPLFYMAAWLLAILGLVPVPDMGLPVLLLQIISAAIPLWILYLCFISDTEWESQSSHNSLWLILLGNLDLTANHWFIGNEGGWDSYRWAIGPHIENWMPITTVSVVYLAAFLMIRKNVR